MTAIFVYILKMEKILEKLVGSAPDEPSVEASGGATDLNLTSDDMNDVMKVLTGFDDYAEAVNASENGSAAKVMEETFTSVQDMAKVVDKATLANEKFLELNQHQGELERRYQALSRRINKLRCLTLGTHITEELASLRDFCDKAAPPLPPAPPPPTLSLTTPPPKLPNFNLGSLKPLNMPDGVVLPSVPHQSPVSLPTQPIFPLPTAPDIKVKEEIDEMNGMITPKVPKVPPPTFEEKQKVIINSRGLFF